MTKSIIVARSINHVIGKEGKMPWHLPADMKHFKQITNGHHVIMGRKTFESLPNSLPGRKLIIVSHNPDYQAKNGTTVFSLRAALDVAREENETEVFIAGGSAIYQEALIWADKIYLTLVHTQIEDGDTFFPILDSREWTEISRLSYSSDNNNPYSYDFIELVRRG
ncbi:MAG: hypothetical protein BGO68_05610 [Candidatus Amoebophilus sp. 36-38]|nr:MAG: hypothetical protein BGO68_05610 [Candidatus Amoebophilus sp. 36-38]